MSDSAVILRPTLGEKYHQGPNSFNFLRIFLASAVLLSHAAGFEGLSYELVNHYSVGQIAVGGFFVLSGFLITESAVRSTAWRFTLSRILRIFPGLLACLALTAWVLGYIYHRHAYPVGASYGNYLGLNPGPWSYFWKNALLANPFTPQSFIGTSPMSYFPVWNGPLYTLFYEFCCYFVVLALVRCGAARRRFVLLLVTVALWTMGTVFSFIPYGATTFNVWSNCNLFYFLQFLSLFLAGSTIYVYRDKLPDSKWWALAGLAVYVTFLLLPFATATRIPGFTFTPVFVGGPFVAYAVIWLGLHLPFTTVGSKNDLSYGVYIYGWPITQMVLLWNVVRFSWTAHYVHFGPYPVIIASFVCTLPFAWLSWRVVEKPALDLKKRFGVAPRRLAEATLTTNESENAHG